MAISSSACIFISSGKSFNFLSSNCCCLCYAVFALQCLRSKTRTLFNYPSSPDQLPIWNFDGSSTGQAVGHDSDVYMKPVALYPDPMLPGENCLVLCETQDKDGNPHVTNNRSSCEQVSSNPFSGNNHHRQCLHDRSCERCKIIIPGLG